MGYTASLNSPNSIVIGNPNPSASITSGYTSSHHYQNPIRNTGVIIGNSRDTKLSGQHITVVSATDRPFETESERTIFLRADNGVMIETTTPGEFINASEELEKIDDILDELREIKEMLHDMYWAPPNGPGYLKSQMNFDNLKEDNDQLPISSSPNIPIPSTPDIPISSTPDIPFHSSSRYSQEIPYTICNIQ